jgi:hypothetical protein
MDKEKELIKEINVFVIDWLEDCDYDYDEERYIYNRSDLLQDLLDLLEKKFGSDYFDDYNINSYVDSCLQNNDERA